STSSRSSTPSLSLNSASTSAPHSLSLHDALPISGSISQFPSTVYPASLYPMEEPPPQEKQLNTVFPFLRTSFRSSSRHFQGKRRSEEHTSELQSRFDLVCRLLLEKKNTTQSQHDH